MSDMSEPSLAACAGDHIGKIGHERRSMVADDYNQTFVCPACGYLATEEAVRRAVPMPYRGSEPIVMALQAMLDYRLLVVFGRRGPIVEYPRPSLDPVR